MLLQLFAIVCVHVWSMVVGDSGDGGHSQQVGASTEERKRRDERVTDGVLSKDQIRSNANAININFDASSSW